MSSMFLLAAMFAFIFVPSVAQAELIMPVAVNVSAKGDDNRGQITIDFDKPVAASYQLLDQPWRLMIDLEQIGYGFQLEPASWKGLLAGVRYGDMAEGHSRMILEFSSPFNLTDFSNVSNSTTGGHSLVIEYERADAEVFHAAVVDNMQTASVVQRSGKADRIRASDLANIAPDEIVVVIDPGHGGIDSGAVGYSGTREKDITLDFSEQLVKALGDLEGVRVVRTRDKDVFVSLNDRVAFSRDNGAALFVSIHADSVRQDYVRGATVYTISDKASDSIAASLAESENLSDSIAGFDYREEGEEVASILVDLARRETLGFSVQFARLAISHMSKTARMNNNAHRYAGFRVLKAPDVPSVLVELGYLSNKEDEQLLRQPEWRQNLANEIAGAVAEFIQLSKGQVAQR